MALCSSVMARSRNAWLSGWVWRIILAKYYLYSFAYILPRPSIFSRIFSNIYFFPTTAQRLHAPRVDHRAQPYNARGPTDGPTSASGSACAPMGAHSARNSTPASPASHISISSSPASSTTLARRGEFEATESEDCNSSTATTPKGDYKDKRKLTFHKEDGKKTKFGTITDTWAASWEPKDHTKRGPPDATA